MDGPEILKYIKCKDTVDGSYSLNGYLLEYQKEAENVRFDGRRPVRKRQLRWEDISRDSSLFLSIKCWSKLSGGRGIWRRTVEEARTDVGFHAIEGGTEGRVGEGGGGEGGEGEGGEGERGEGGEGERGE